MSTLTDEEIASKISGRTTPELFAFRDKLNKMDTPESWGIKFYIIRELLFRYVTESRSLTNGRKPITLQVTTEKDNQ